jgi:undecaprenyl-diphosphatase
MSQVIVFTASYLFITLPLLWVVSLVLQKDNKKLLAQGFVAAVIATPTAIALVWIASRIMYSSRPFVVNNFTPLIPHAANNGFPSDHTTLCMFFASLVFYNNKKLGIVGFILTLLVGLSRVAAGVHSITDIIGGLVIGFVAATVGYYLSELIVKKYPKNSNKPQESEQTQ